MDVSKRAGWLIETLEDGGLTVTDVGALLDNGCDECWALTEALGEATYCAECAEENIKERNAYE